MMYDSDDEMTGKDPFRDEVVLGEGEEGYRELDDLNDVPTEESAQYAQYDEGVTAPYESYARYTDFSSIQLLCWSSLYGVSQN